MRSASFRASTAFPVGNQLGLQGLGVLAVGTYTAIVTWVILKVVGWMVSNRVSAEDESAGLDLLLHGERGYVFWEAEQAQAEAAETATEPKTATEPGSKSDSGVPA